ncbi:hypothetical protein MNEG_9923 [Monoraphidium neglectum]|uniref:Uncharacterized protein n=1 Tax=Monoraphidium neglectum TaxID=145388 RepID=A0A0D2M379_9CHLO|nr:hypothetical protein MNEG_9923 [Monoraphidium neglectum]KIY98039.1 hypothetical protein MNEG_9923 [Monoraphidium neglectum]|eukprot:XP_013897059.1 hypothetical protein MNEG_9923 [Monoraphidium neglectum]
MSALSHVRNSAAGAAVLRQPRLPLRPRVLLTPQALALGPCSCDVRSAALSCRQPLLPAEVDARAAGSIFGSNSSSKRRTLVIRESGAAGGLGSHGGASGDPVDTWPKRLLLGVALAYISLVVLVPFLNVFFQVCR